MLARQRGLLKQLLRCLMTNLHVRERSEGWEEGHRLTGAGRSAQHCNTTSIRPNHRYTASNASVLHSAKREEYNKLKEAWIIGKINLPGIANRPIADALKGFGSNKSRRHDTYIRWYLRTGCVRMKENRTFWKKEIRFVTSFDLIKGLKQIK